MKTYNQLTGEQRSQIYALNKTDLSQNKIAKQLDARQSTISRSYRVIQANAVIALNKLDNWQNNAS